MKRMVILTTLFCLLTPLIFCQNNEEETAEDSYGLYLDRLIFLEARLEEEGTLADYELDEISQLRMELKTTEFQDLYLEGNLLAFLAESEIRRAREETAAPELLEDIMKDIRRGKRRERNIRNKRFWKGFTMGSAIVGAGVFNLLSYTSRMSYDNYIKAEDPEEAFFYQQRWEMLDKGTLGALGFIGVNIFINGILQLTDLF